LDTRGIAGTLSLNPWTAQAIAQSGEDKETGQFTGLYSTSDLTQLSIAGEYGDRAAILLGNSSGLMNGPSGSLSARIYHDDRLDVRFHLLTTDVDSTIKYNPPEPISSHALTVRNIPVLQVDWNISPDVKFKSSIYYDNTYLRDEDFSQGYFTQERVQQVGMENALFVSGWKFGASVRKVAFAQYSNNVPFVAPDETTASFQISKLLVLAGDIGNRLMLEGTAQLTDVNRFGSYPEGTVGVRQEWDSGRSGAYARGNFTRRFPSLVDRFYVFQGFIPNPALTPEKDFTGIIGVETHQSRWDASAQVYEQLRENTQATITDQNGNYTPIEAGNAHLFSLVLTAGVRPIEEIRIFNSANFTRTHVDLLDASFPYIPNFIDVLGAEATLGHGVAVDAEARAQAMAYTGPGTTLPGTAYLDLGASYDLNARIKLMGRIENITGNNVVLSPLSPPKERTFSVAINGAL
jgi:outer membrane cobalamin receptor